MKRKFSRYEKFVDEFCIILSRRLKRNLVWRAGNGRQRKVFYIYDPVFLSVQRDGRWKDKGRYTSGFYMDFRNAEYVIGFRTEHTRILFENLILGLEDSESLLSISKKVMKRRSLFMWSSRAVFKSSRRKKHILEYSPDTYADFRMFLKEKFGRNLQSGWLGDLGVEMPLTYKGASDFGKRLRGTSRGSLFMVARFIRGLNRRQIDDVFKVVEPLFLYLYPTKVGSFRNANLKRALLKEYKLNHLQLECAFKGCKKMGPDLEAAHIIPAWRGGTDRAENGVFLCHEHHRYYQEGKPLDLQKKILKKRFLAHTRLG